MFCPVCRSEYADDWKVCPRDTATLLRSQFIGKYRIDQLIGAGGMGAVYKAYNPDTQSAVAIKLMHGGAAAHDAARQRFQREASAVAALKTRHAVQIFDFGSDVDGSLYLVMEFLHGHPLRQEIHPPPHGMALPRVNFVIDQSLRGLGAAHRAAIVHRDLKPENLFVADTDDGEVVKVLDFGIARVSRGDTPNLTHSGALMGTPAYMAPEQVAGNRGQVGRHSDVYAMGVIVYELLTGGSPFHAETLSEVLSRILSRQFVPLAQIRPDLPLAVIQLVERAIADDPAARFGSADAMREAWAAAWAQLPADIRQAPVPSFTAAHTLPPEHRPSVGLHTDVPSAPTVGQLPVPAVTPASAGTPPGPMSERRQVAVADTIGTAPGGPHGGGAGAAMSHGVAHGASHAVSMTPESVVVDTSQPPAKKSGKGLVIGMGALVAVGLGTAAALGVFKKSDDNPEPGAGTGTGTGTNQKLVAADAGAVAVADAGTAAVPVADAAPAPVADPVPTGMAKLAGGTFTMGLPPAQAKKIPDAEVAHEVTVGPFLLDQREVTEGALRGGDSALPAGKVTWDEASAYCAGLGKRLPTSAEWEHAAKQAPSDPKKARMRTSKPAPAPVGTHPGDCTADGICDLLGNVMEWTADAWPGRDGHRVIRGGHFKVSPSAAYYATIQARLSVPGTTAEPELGFRCAADVTAHVEGAP